MMMRPEIIGIDTIAPPSRDLGERGFLRGVFLEMALCVAISMIFAIVTQRSLTFQSALLAGGTLTWLGRLVVLVPLALLFLGISDRGVEAALNAAALGFVGMAFLGAWYLLFAR